MLKEHRSKDDAWTAINGKVYNITPYLDYHPGGVPELMRVAGRDGTKLFGESLRRTGRVSGILLMRRAYTRAPIRTNARVGVCGYDAG